MIALLLLRDLIGLQPSGEAATGGCKPPPGSELAEDTRGEQRWKLWGSYLSERQWGTVREDYSAHGTAWDYFSHDQARSRAYRWGEDGLTGLSDNTQRLCLALALWNGKDPILKERLFGLTNGEGNHGEDVKQLYYYLDATPTHSYLKYLYKYPQREFPYAWLDDVPKWLAGDPKLQSDPHFRNHLLFYEYFHGDNGRGVGASHQTGWTGAIAKLLQPRCREGGQSQS